MTSQDPESLSPASRGTALLVARVIFFNGLLIGLGLTIAAVGVVFFNVGNIAVPMERWLVGAVFIGLAIMAFGFTWTAKSKIAKLKSSR